MDIRFGSATHCLEWFFSRKGSIFAGKIEQGVAPAAETTVRTEDGDTSTIPTTGFEDYVVAIVDVERFLASFPMWQQEILATLIVKGRKEAVKKYHRALVQNHKCISSRQTASRHLDSLLECFENVLRENDYWIREAPEHYSTTNE